MSDIQFLPYFMIEAMGLRVIDERTNPSEHDEITDAIDPKDRYVKIVDGSGGLIYDSETNKFDRIIPALWRAYSKGESVINSGQNTVFQKEGRSKRNWFVFENGKISESTTEIKTDTQYGNHSIKTFKFTFENGLPVEAYVTSKNVNAKWEISGYKIEHIKLKNLIPAGATLKAFANGWFINVDGINFKVFIDPNDPIASMKSVGTVASFSQYISKELVQKYFERYKEKYKSDFIPIHIHFPKCYANDIWLFKKRLLQQNITNLYANGTIWDKEDIEEASYEELSDIANFFWQQYVHMGFHTTAAFRFTNEQFFIHSDDSLIEEILIHEFAHGIFYAMGRATIAEWDDLFDKYMDYAIDHAELSDDERSILRHAVGWQYKRISEGKRVEAIQTLEKLAKQGWLPSWYAGTGSSEFFAELYTCSLVQTSYPNEGPIRYEKLMSQISNITSKTQSFEEMGKQMQAIDISASFH